MSYSVYESTPRGTFPVEYPNPGCEFCQDCGDEQPCSQLSFVRIGMEDVTLCAHCFPKCNLCGAPVSMIGERELRMRHEVDACIEVLQADPGNRYAQRTLSEIDGAR